MSSSASTELCPLPRFAPDIERLFLENELRMLGAATADFEAASIEAEQTMLGLQSAAHHAFLTTPYRKTITGILENLPEDIQLEIAGTLGKYEEGEISSAQIRHMLNSSWQRSDPPLIPAYFAHQNHPDHQQSTGGDDSFKAFTEAKANGNNALAHTLLAKSAVNTGFQGLKEADNLASMRLAVARAYGHLNAVDMPFVAREDVLSWAAIEKSYIPLNIRTSDVTALTNIILQLFADRLHGKAILSEPQIEDVRTILDNLHAAKELRGKTSKPFAADTRKMAAFDTSLAELSAEIMQNTQELDDLSSYRRSQLLSDYLVALSNLSKRLPNLQLQDEQTKRMQLISLLGAAALGNIRY